MPNLLKRKARLIFFILPAVIMIAILGYSSEITNPINAATCPLTTKNCVPCGAGELYCRYTEEDEYGYLGWACQNNNPTNIKYSDYRIGLIEQMGGQAPCGQKGTFMVFPNYQTGRNSTKAYIKAINAGLHYAYPTCGNCSLLEFYQSYAPDNPEVYSQRIAEIMGSPVTKRTKLSWIVDTRLDDFINAMMRMEGFFTSSGDVQSSVALVAGNVQGNRRMVVSVRKSDGNIYTRRYTNENEYGNWEKNGSTQGDVKLTRFVNSEGEEILIQSARSDSNRLIQRYSVNGADWSSWSYDRKINGNPSFAAFTYRGTTRSTSFITLLFSGIKRETLTESVLGLNDLVYSRSSYDGINWTNWIASEGNISEDISTAVLHFSEIPIERGAHGGNKDILFQTSRNNSGHLVTRYSENGLQFTAWEIGKRIHGKPEIASFSPLNLHLTSNPQMLVQSVRGTDDFVYTRYSKDGAVWSDWRKSIKTNVEMEFATYKRGIAEILYQAVIGSDNRVRTRYTFDGINWSDWEAGEKSKTRSTMISYLPDVPDNNRSYIASSRLYQAIVKSDEEIYLRYTTNGTTWTDWERF
ncbi:MAG: hypothetical protein PHS44_03030 [Candidatus Dojkabacteria bacterium]|nr:hypothetical protein [Candidatus Dojkabacteria bacterium]